MSEPSVSYSDFALALLNMWLAWKMWAAPVERKNLRDHFMGLFIGTSLSALAGALFHGYYKDSQVGDYLWITVLVMVGLSGYNLWLILGDLTLSERLFKIFRWLNRICFLIYLSLIFAGHIHFTMAIFAYIPASLVFMFYLLLRVARDRKRHEVFGLLAFALAFLAATIQQMALEIDPQYLNHNTIYHLVTGLGSWCLYLYGSRASRWNL